MMAAVRYAGFIRNVMIGREGLTADVLLTIAERCGAENPTSHLATGNIAFDAHPADVDEIRRRLQDSISTVIEHHEPVFVRSIDDLRRAAANDPFADVSFPDVHHRCVTYLQAAPDRLGPLPVQSPRGDVTIFAVVGRDAYSVTHLVDGRAASPGPLLERATREPVTSRNWNTIEHVLDKQTALERSA